MSKFVHQELHTSDPGDAKRFYAALFGWTYHDMPMPDGVYSMIMSPDGGIGGLSAPAPGTPTGWLGYVEVASVDVVSRKVVANGGQVVLPRQEVPGMGWFAWCTDPQGIRFAVWEPAPVEVKKVTKKKAAKKKASKKPAAKAKKPAAKAKKPAKKKASGKARRKPARAK